jgi:hypothetical protein
MRASACNHFEEKLFSEMTGLYELIKQTRGSVATVAALL